MAFLVIGVITGVVLVQQQQYFRLRASGELRPRSVRITNITEGSFSVSFFTERESISSINYGQTNKLQNTQTNPDTNLANLHHLTVSGLEENTNYLFTINSGGKDFDNNGVPWQTQTAVKLESNPNNDILSGTVFKQDNIPASGALVYLQAGGASNLSTQTSENGTWVLPLSRLRTQSMDEYFVLDDDQHIELFIQGGTEGIATIKISKEDAISTPTVNLGNSYDFTNLESTPNKLPEAQITLPADRNEARFEISTTPLPVSR